MVEKKGNVYTCVSLRLVVFPSQTYDEAKQKIQQQPWFFL